jgi:hypothetical protein
VRKADTGAEGATYVRSFFCRLPKYFTLRQNVDIQIVG